MSRDSVIFEQSRVGQEWRPRRPLAVSIAVHALMFLILLASRRPVFVAPKSSLAGAHGSTITHIYWGTGTAQAAESSSIESKANRAHARLTMKQFDRAALSAPVSPAADESQKPFTTANAAAPAPTAGSPYGSLSDGSASGEDIRPALPAVTSEPHVNPEDLQGIMEGNVVVEITIDEKGNIVRKDVTRSMGPAIDAKVLAALENWRFRPATRDGVPIPSKQDVVYHFKPRPS